MKSYRIPVTHTAKVVVEHEVEAKNMQEAMFKLGQTLVDAPTPFDCVDHDDLEAEIKPGTPEIVGSPSLLDGIGE